MYEEVFDVLRKFFFISLPLLKLLADVYAPVHD